MVTENRNSQYWHQEFLPLAKDCYRCPDYGLCGGIRIAADVSSCLSLSSSVPGRSRSTNSVSKSDPLTFVQRKREVNGWELHVPKVNSITSAQLPRFIPIIYGRARRSVPLLYDTVAIPLSKILSRRTGAITVKTRNDLCNRFLIDQGSKIIISGVHHDPTLETYWSLGRAHKVWEQLKQLDVELVTTPNFSVFSDVERYDNFHNMKRIAICWHELCAAGNPTALHVNARTLRDYERWGDFLNEHTEIDTIAFEFQTGTGSAVRSLAHLTWLQSLVVRTRRSLKIISFGGWQHLIGMEKMFHSVSHISATPFMKTSHYKKLVHPDGNGCKLLEASADMPRDQLLLANILACAMALSKRASEAA